MSTKAPAAPAKKRAKAPASAPKRAPAKRKAAKTAPPAAPLCLHATSGLMLVRRGVGACLFSAVRCLACGHEAATGTTACLHYLLGLINDQERRLAAVETQRAEVLRP